MKNWLNSRGTLVTALAGFTVLIVFGTGTAVAGSLITSANIKNNTIRSVDVRTNSLQSSDIRNGTINSADVADGSLSNADVGVLFASVNADGTVAASSGAVTVSKPATGRYGVRFTGRNIKGCAFTATPAHPTGLVAPTGVISVIDELNHPESAYLFTKDLAGADTDMGFHLTVVC